MNIKSIDLRGRVVDFIESGGKIVEACRLFKVSSSSVYRWRKQKDKVGHLVPKTPSRKSYKVDDKELLSYLEAHPDAYQSEIASHFEVTQPCISRAFKCLSITRKKRLVCIKKRMR